MTNDYCSNVTFTFIQIGLIFNECEPQQVLCKPKLLPLKSFTLEKLEKMQKDATLKAQETILEQRREMQNNLHSQSSQGKVEMRYIEYWNIIVMIIMILHYFMYNN